MCCSGPKWKREIVPDHKFDFVDTREFTDNGCMMRTKYLFLYISILISFLVYVSDIFTGITMLTTKAWANQIANQCVDNEIEGCIAIPFNTGKWLFVGCIIFSFLLLAYESRKAKKIIASRDISYAFTNVMANNYYSLRSYDHFCFFDHISNSTKTSDDFAFFVFFVFKSWKRVLLADGPRQTINGLTLYAIFLSRRNEEGEWYDLSKYFAGNNLSTTAITITTLFTVSIFAISLLLLIVAGLCYVPLLCHIRGNLKEYCCHKVDKRISTVIKRRQKQRLAEASKLAQKEAMGDFSHLKNKKGEFIAKPLPQPTLPNLSVDDDDDAGSIKRGAPSTYTATTNAGQDQYYFNAPPMPAFNPNATQQPGTGYPQYNQSQYTVGGGGYDDSLYNYPPQQQKGDLYDDDNDSTAHLALGAAPFAYNSAGGYDSRPGTTAPYGERPGTTGPYGERPGTTAPYQQQQYEYDPHDVYQGQGRAISPSNSNDPFGRSGTADPYARSGAADPYARTGTADPYARTGTADPFPRSGTADPHRQRSPAPPTYQQYPGQQQQQSGAYDVQDYPSPNSAGPDRLAYAQSQHSSSQQYLPPSKSQGTGGGGGYAM